MIPRLVNDISAFKKKFKPFNSQLKSKDFSKSSQLRQQSECAEDHANFTDYIKKVILIPGALESRLSDFATEEDCILAFL